MSRLFLSHSSKNNKAAIALKDWLKEEGWDDVFLDLDPNTGIAPGQRWLDALHESANHCEAVLFLVSRDWLVSDWCEREFDLAQNLNKRCFGIMIDDLGIDDIPLKYRKDFQLVNLRQGVDHGEPRKVQFDDGQQEYVTFSQAGLARLKNGLVKAELDPRLAARTFKAFISYRHADNNHAGRQWATWLHQQIETYQIPKELVGRKTRSGNKIPDRIFPVFLDEEELPSDADLGVNITKALESSEYLVVICSPNACKSKYVADEIEYFKKLGRSDRIKPVIIAGEPNASWDDSKHNEFINESSECFPEPLQFSYDNKGIRTKVRAEPIYTDFRIKVDGRSQECWTSLEALKADLISNTELPDSDIREQLELYEKQQKLMVLKIISGILGVSLGELTQRDKEYQLAQERKRIKRLIQWSLSIALIAILAVVASIIAWNQTVLVTKQKDEAERQKKEMLINQSRFLSNQAGLSLDKHDIDTAILLALNGLPGFYGGERPHSVYVENDLIYSMSRYRSIAWFRDDYYAPINSAQFSPDGKQVVTVTHKSVNIWDLDQPEGPIAVYGHYNRIDSVQFSRDGKRLMAVSFNDVLVWDVDQPAWPVAVLKHKNIVGSAQFSPNGQWVLTLVANDSKFRIWDVERQKPSLPSVFQNYYHKGFVSKGFLSNQDITDEQFKELEIQLITDQSWNYSGRRHRFNPQLPAPLLDELTTINSAVFSPDSKWIMTSSSGDDAVKIWDVSTQKVLAAFKYNGSVSISRFSPDGQWVLTVSSDNTIKIWDVNTQSTLMVKHYKDEILSAEFSLDGKKLVVVSNEEVRLLDIATFPASTLALFGDNVISAKFSPDGEKVLTFMKDSPPRLWNVTRIDKPLQRGSHPELSEPPFIFDSNTWGPTQFSPDGKRFLTLTSAGSALVWEVTPPEHAIATFQFHYDRQSKTLAKFLHASSDGRRVLATSGYGAKLEISIWDVMQPEQPLAVFLPISRISSVQLSLDGSKVMTVFDHPERVVRHSNGSLESLGWVAIWDIDRPDNPPVVIDKSISMVRFARFSREGDRVVTVRADGVTSEIWDLDSPSQPQVLLKHSHRISDVQLSPDGNHLVAASKRNSTHSYIEVWNLDQPDNPLWVYEPYETIESMEFSQDGKRVLARSASSENTGRVWVWDVSGLEKTPTVLKYDEGPFYSAQFHPDDQKVVTTSYSHLGSQVWSLSNPEKPIKELKLEVQGFEGSFSFSPDGQRMVFRSDPDSKELWLWDIDTQQKLAKFEHDQIILSARFSQDGQRVISYSNNGKLKVWPVVSQKAQDILNNLEKKPQLARTCLTPEERKKYFLSELTDQQWKDRGCPQYASTASVAASESE